MSEKNHDYMTNMEMNFAGWVKQLNDLGLSQSVYESAFYELVSRYERITGEKPDMTRIWAYNVGDINFL